MAVSTAKTVPMTTGKTAPVTTATRDNVSRQTTARNVTGASEVADKWTRYLTTALTRPRTGRDHEYVQRLGIRRGGRRRVRTGGRGAGRPVRADGGEVAGAVDGGGARRQRVPLPKAVAAHDGPGPVGRAVREATAGGPAAAV